MIKRNVLVTALALVMVGCGGSGTLSIPKISVAGDVTVPAPPTTVTPTEAVSAPEGTAVTTTMTVDGVPTEVVVPGGESIAPGDEVYSFAPDLPFAFEDDEVAAAASRSATSAGAVYVNGKYSGLRVSNKTMVIDGTSKVPKLIVTKQKTALTVGIRGPLQIGPTRGDHLTLNGTPSDSKKIAFEINVQDFPIGAALTGATYQLPANRSAFADAFVRGRTNYKHPFTAKLTITSSQWTKSQMVNSTSTTGAFTLENLTQTKDDVVPKSGIYKAKLTLASE